MKIIICGAGVVGRNIARYLLAEGNEITIIDNDAELVRDMTERFDVRGITGFASHPNILARAGAADADMVIAATHSDEVNMVVCQIAHSIFEVTEKVARLRSEAYTSAIFADMYRRDHLPVDVVISPERAVSSAIAQRLRKPSAFDNKTFFEDRIQMLGLTVGDEAGIVNTPLRQLTELFSTFHGTIAGIRRKGVLFVPHGDDQIFVGDDVYLFVTPEDESRAFELFGKVNRRIENIVIIGGGDIGAGIAKILEEKTDARIKIIERDRATAEAISDQLNRSVVLHGDALDPVLLAEANISRADTVIAVTNDDKINLLAAARGKSMGAAHALVIINDSGLDDLSAPLNLDAVVNPRAITVSSILQHIRIGRIHEVYVIGDNEGEIIETEVLPTSPIHGKRIRDIEWPEGARIAAVRKGEVVHIAMGDIRLEAGDWVIIFALREAVHPVEQLFRVSVDYF